MKKEIVRRSTRQRQVILEELSKVKTHPTADSVFRMVRKRLPGISYGTVYRNLNLLRDENKVLELSCGRYSCRYDATVKNHYHFFCLGCKNVFDMEDVPLLKDLDGLTGNNPEFKVVSHRLEFHGYCRKCDQGFKN